jgi:hypothetical protein
MALWANSRLRQTSVEVKHSCRIREWFPSEAVYIFLLMKLRCI